MSFKIRVYQFLRNELRTVLAVSLLLLIFVGLGFAAGETTTTFDFGTGLSTEVAPGAISVSGGGTRYPTVSQGLTYGWTGSSVAEQSDGTAVTDLIRTDSNQGVTTNSFKISALSANYYSVSIISGTLSHAITTKIVVNGVSYLIDSPVGIWKTLTFKAATPGGVLELQFERYGSNLWGVNALTISPSVTPPPDVTFDLIIQPSEHQVSAGGTVVYLASIVPHNGYSAEVTFSLSGLPNGMTSQFSPVTGFPPFTSRLEITTDQNSATTFYSLDITARGGDNLALSTTKRVALTVTPATGETNPIVLPLQTPEDFLRDSKKLQKLIDIYTKAEKNRLPTSEELASLQELPFATIIPILTELPEARSLMDASLRQLTNAGIIGIVVDSAPAVDSTPPPQTGFWTQFWGSMFNPAR